MHRRAGISVIIVVALGVVTALVKGAWAVSMGGTVGSSGAYQITTMPVIDAEHTTLKLTFQNLTAGTTLTLCAATQAQVSSDICAIELANSEGISLWQLLTRRDYLERSYS